MLFAVNGPETSARLFWPTWLALDAFAAELKSSAEAQTIIDATTPMANEFFFLAALSMLPIVARRDAQRKRASSS